MSYDFSFVKDGFDNIVKGDAARKEIHNCIAAFKEVLHSACKEEFGVDVSYDNGIHSSIIGKALAMPVSSANKLNSGKVIVFAKSIWGFKIFSYELDPIRGYPVEISYVGKTVSVDNKSGLMSAINEAFNYAAGSIRELCLSGYSTGAICA